MDPYSPSPQTPQSGSSYGSFGPAGAGSPVPPPPGAGQPAPGQKSNGGAKKSKRDRIWLPVTTAAVGAALGSSILTASLMSTSAETAPAQNSVSTNTASQVANHDSVNWQATAERVRPAVVAIAMQGERGGGEGSGVIIDAQGRIVTNDHVVAGAKELRVTLSDGRILPATVIGTDPTTDLAVIELDEAPDDIQFASFADSDDVNIGDPVMAVGNPLGLDSTVTTGIVSALDRPVSTAGKTEDPFTRAEPVVTNAIQIDAAINPGNSGGPLFNTAGEVIGINSSIAALAGGTSGSIGLGFAIPAVVAQNVSGQLIDSGQVEHARLGVSLSTASVETEGVSRQGAKIEQVVEDSAAARAELQAGDVIIAFNDKPVGGAESLTGFVRGQRVGTQVQLTVVRDGVSKEIAVDLGSSSPEI